MFSAASEGCRCGRSGSIQDQPVPRHTGNRPTVEQTDVDPHSRFGLASPHMGRQVNDTPSWINFFAYQSGIEDCWICIPCDKAQRSAGGDSSNVVGAKR